MMNILLTHHIKNLTKNNPKV